jgi:hypothetical protein
MNVAGTYAGRRPCDSDRRRRPAVSVAERPTRASQLSTGPLDGRFQGCLVGGAEIAPTAGPIAPEKTVSVASQARLSSCLGSGAVAARTAGSSSVTVGSRYRARRANRCAYRGIVTTQIAAS